MILDLVVCGEPKKGKSRKEKGGWDRNERALYSLFFISAFVCSPASGPRLEMRACDVLQNLKRETVMTSPLFFHFVPRRANVACLYRGRV